MNEETVIHELTPVQKSEGALDAAVISRVIDADTIEVILHGNMVDVRLLLIDAPETVHPDQPVEKFGPEACAFTKEKLEGKTIVLEYDGPKWDAYGRLLAYVWLEERMLNEMLLEAGLAEVRYIYNPPYKYYDVLMKAQRKAALERRGMWGTW